MPDIPPANPIDNDPAASRDLLERILKAVENQKRPHWMQLMRAIVLSLAALASAWSAYQASRWSNIAGNETTLTANAKRWSALGQIEALQIRTLDGMLGLHFLEAKQAANEPLAAFLLSRFRPAFQPTVDAWLKTEPMTNAAAPRTPFEMKEYVSAEFQKSERYEQEAQQHATAAAASARAGNSLVLLTLLFATVLFLGGLANTLPFQRLEHIVSAGALVVFASTLIRLLTLPIAPWN